MKKCILFVLIPIIFYVLGIVSSPFFKNRENVNKKEFAFIGSLTDSLISDNYRSDLADISYDNNTDPYGVYCLKKGIVSTPNLAYTIAKSLLEELYGTKEIEDEFPLRVSLVNNKFWIIEGTLKSGAKGGVATIVIKKDDGQIQYVKHEK